MKYCVGGNGGAYKKTTIFYLDDFLIDQYKIYSDDIAIYFSYINYTMENNRLASFTVVIALLIYVN